MANIDTNFNGLTKLRNWWGKVKQNFISINNEVVANKVEHDAHIAGASGRHSAEHINYTGTAGGNNTKEAIENIKADIDNLSFTGSEHDALVTASLIDAEGENFGPDPGNETYLDGRLTKWEQKTIAHLADKTHMICPLNAPYNATGLGVLDEYAKLVQAMTDAVEQGKALLIPKNYVFASASRIEIPSGLRIVGSGTIKALPLVGETVEGFLYGDSKENVSIRGITVDCDPANQTHQYLYGIYLTNSPKTKINSVNVNAVYGGIAVRTDSHYSEVKNCTVDQTYGSEDVVTPDKGVGILVAGNGSKVNGNTVLGVKSTKVDSYGGIGIVLGGDAGKTYEQLEATGNNIDKSYTGIAANGIKHSRITKNSVKDCKSANHSQAVMLKNCEAVTISENPIKNIDYTAIALVDSFNCIISKNPITNDVPLGDNSDSNKANGVTISYTSDPALCRNNVVNGNIIELSSMYSASGRYNAFLLRGNGHNLSNNNFVTKTGELCPAVGLDLIGEDCIVEANTLKGTYHVLKVSDAGGEVTSKNNKFANNIISVETGTYAIYDASTGPNDYDDNTVLAGSVLYSNSHNIREPGNTLTPLRKSADYTVQKADAGRRINNISATGIVTYTLPVADSTLYGKQFHFVRIANFAIHIDPNGTNIFRGQGAGKYMSLDSLGANVTLECNITGIWDIVSSSGTISYET